LSRLKFPISHESAGIKIPLPAAVFADDSCCESG
jgi:hypothetical protein